LKDIRRNPLLWLLAFVPVVLVAQKVKPEAHTLLFVLSVQASDDDNGLQLQSRYEQKIVPGGLGNAYHAFYAGINYLLYRDRFKLMNGVEYSMMKSDALGHDRYNGWTFFSGVRVYF
jgi:hypothetical protein